MRIKAKLTPNEIVIPPHVVANNREMIDAYNRIGLLARNLGGMAYMRDGGEAWDRQVFIRKLLEEVKPGSLDERILLDKLGIDPVTYKQVGGEVEEPTPFYKDDRLGQLGQSLVALGQRDFKGASAALVPVAGKEGEDSDLSNKAKALEAANEEVVELAQRALTLVPAAASAGDLINGFASFDKDTEAKLTSEVDQKVKGFLTGLVQTVAGAFDQTRRVREEARARIVSSQDPEGYRNYVRLRQLANALVLPVVSSGALGVNPTDKDVELAKQAQFDITSPSNTWTSQLTDLINRSGGVAEAVAAIAEQTGNTETVAAVQAGITNVNTEVVTNDTIDVSGGSTDDGDTGCLLYTSPSPRDS